jgi:ABC-type branched-subunit amino acid transport system ATPase component
LTPILEARGLMKRYGKIHALAGLDLTVDSPSGSG